MIDNIIDNMLNATIEYVLALGANPSGSTAAVGEVSESLEQQITSGISDKPTTTNTAG